MQSSVIDLTISDDDDDNAAADDDGDDVVDCVDLTLFDDDDDDNAADDDDRVEPSSVGTREASPVLAPWTCTDAGCKAVRVCGARVESVEEKERKLRLELQAPRLQLIRRNKATGFQLGNSVRTKALCIDLDPERGQLGSLRSLQSSLHLLRCDVSRGVVQVAPLLRILRQHLARVEPHVEAGNDDTSKEVEEEHAIRHALFDALMELVPLVEYRQCDVHDTLSTLFQGIHLSKAEASEWKVRSSAKYGTLFFRFAVECINQHSIGDLKLALVADVRKQLLDELVELTELVSKYRLDGRQEQMMNAIGSTIDLVARCDLIDVDAVPMTLLRGSSAQSRLMRLAEELHSAIFNRGDRGSLKPEHAAKWQPMQQWFVEMLQNSCPLLALLVLDRRLSPRSTMQHLWSRLANWEHVAIPDRLQELVLGGLEAVDAHEHIVVVGHVWLLASLYSAALEVVCGSSSLWTVDEAKLCVDSERTQSSRQLALHRPFENPARRCDELLRVLGWSEQHVTGTRLRIALESIHAVFLHS